jgi:heme A synthase
MSGGVLFEHSHRLAASTVGLLTIWLAVALWTKRQEYGPIAKWGLVAAALVVFQGVLGGITVIYQLPLLVSTTHLATAMGFFALTIYLVVRIRAHHLGGDVAPLARRTVAVVLALTYVQLLLGAFVRHTGSGLACNTDLLTCNGTVVPVDGPGWLHMSHRLLAVIVSVAVFWLSLKLRQEDGHRRPAMGILTMTAPIVVVIQFGLGLWTVMSFLSPPVVTAHLGGGALLFANLWVIFLMMGPLGVPASDETSDNVSHSDLAHAS